MGVGRRERGKPETGDTTMYDEIANYETMTVKGGWSQEEWNKQQGGVGQVDANETNELTEMMKQW
jgi:hypothetical protein